MYLWVCRPGGYFGRASNMSLQHKEHVQCAFCFGYHPFSVKGMASFWRPYLLWYQPPLRKRKLGIEKGVWRGAEGGLELVAYQKRERGTDAVGTRLGGSATLPSTTTPAAPPMALSWPVLRAIPWKPFTQRCSEGSGSNAQSPLPSEDLLRAFKKSLPVSSMKWETMFFRTPRALSLESQLQKSWQHSQSGGGMGREAAYSPGSSQFQGQDCHWLEPLHTICSGPSPSPTFSSLGSGQKRTKNSKGELAGGRRRFPTHLLP